MFKKLCILLIFSKLNEIKHLIDKYRMHNLYAIFAKLLNICKQIAGNLVNESGNVPRRGVVPKFSDLEVVALNMASEAVGIDSESLLFANLQEYRVEIPNLISRRQYNDRRKITSSLCNAIRERMVAKMDGGEDYFCIDSKPIEVSVSWLYLPWHCTTLSVRKSTSTVSIISPPILAESMRVSAFL